jgi:hypothetical protein
MKSSFLLTLYIIKIKYVDNLDAIPSPQKEKEYRLNKGKRIEIR